MLAIRHPQSTTQVALPPGRERVSTVMDEVVSSCSAKVALLRVPVLRQVQRESEDTLAWLFQSARCTGEGDGTNFCVDITLGNDGAMYRKEETSTHKLTVGQVIRPALTRYLRILAMVGLPVDLAPVKFEGEPFPVQIKTMTGKTVSVVVDPADTVETLKVKVQEKEGIPPDQQRLIFGGLQLEDQAFCYECGIKADDVVHLVLRMRGGMYHRSSGREDFETAKKLTYRLRFLKPDGTCALELNDLNGARTMSDVMAATTPVLELMGAVPSRKRARGD